MRKATAVMKTAKRRSGARLPFATKLRELGFRRVHPDRDPLTYERSIGVMKVDVQLWLDGRHRASSSVDGHHDKVPTDFETVEDMINAIAVEVDAADRKLRSEANLLYRARLIEHHVKETFGLGDCGEASLRELRSDPNRSWTDVARAVAQKVQRAVQP